MLKHTDINRSDFDLMRNMDAHVFVRRAYGRILSLAISSCAAFALLVLTSLNHAAHAYTKQFGDVTVQVDATVGFGTSVRVADRDLNLLNFGNGGIRNDTTIGADGIIMGALGKVLPALVERGVLTEAQRASYFTERTVGQVIGDLNVAGVAPLAGLLTAGNTGVNAEATAALMAEPLSALCGQAHALSQYARTLGTHGMFDNTYFRPVERENNEFLRSVGLSETYNYDAAINTDDGRLNFDSGDLTSGNFKATVDIEVSSGPYKFFTRVNAFYDAILDSDSSYERTGITDHIEDQLVHDLQILDLYFSVDTELANLPLHVRVGRQVINWGEATFIFGGNGIFNPLNVAAFRRPGTEIKEAFLPVEAIFLSLALPADLTLEAYYGGWDRFEIDPAGSPFSTADFVEPGSAANGFRTYVGGGTFSGANRRNCRATDASDPTSNAVNKLIRDAIVGVIGACPAEPGFLDISNPLARGDIERSRQSYATTVVENPATPDDPGNTLGVLRDTNFLTKVADDWSNGSDNYGIALRWYSDDLGSTEFGFYYQNYASRIPYVSTVAYQPEAGISTTAPNTSSTLRGAAASGCAGTAARQIAALNVGGPGSFIHGGFLIGTQIADPTGLAAGVRQALFGLDPATLATTRDFANPDAANAIIDAAAIALLGRSEITDAGDQPPHIDDTKAWLTNIAKNALTVFPENSYAQAVDLGCITTLAQATSGALLPTGASTVVANYKTGIFNEYPEGIDVYGFSFNTTIGGWGVQGEASYRPNMPLQLDVDSLAIAVIGASCAWDNFSAVGTFFRSLQTIPTECGDWNEPVHGYVREDVYNLDVGTTATFTRSNPGVAALGADLAILLTEIGVVHAPDVDYYAQSNDNALATNIPRLANQCTSGSDLPLGGVFGLDPRGPLNAETRGLGDHENGIDNRQPTTMCRPTATSWGIVVVGQLQYNNAGGSPLTVRPTIAYSRGIDGRSPSPAGSFRKDVYSLALSVSLEYQSTWRADFGYTVFGGPTLYTANGDRDYLSMSFSYAFE